MGETRVYDMIVVGGGPGGYTAALYAARAGLDTLVLEKLSAGGQMALTEEIDNYPGFEDGIDGFTLAEKMQRQAERFGAQTAYAQVERMELTAAPKALKTSEGTFYARTVILATGANPRELGLAGEEALVGRGVAYCAACDGMRYKGKTVAVVGGGVAGMEAAISCAMRGHTVVLYEKTDRLGGQALLSDPMWFKKEMKLFHEYLERQVKKRPSITVVYNTEATPEIIDQNDFDAVIVAVGAEQIVPRIPGVEKATMSFDVFGHEDKVGKKVVIIGGGAIGVELGIHLSGLGHECTIVEMAEYLASKAQLTERTSYLNAIKKYGVKTMVNARCTEITDKGATVETPEGSQFLEADTVIIAVGTKPLVNEREKFKDVAFDVISVGDCVKASSIVHAVHTGFDAGLTL